MWFSPNVFFLISLALLQGYQSNPKAASKTPTQATCRLTQITYNKSFGPHPGPATFDVIYDGNNITEFTSATDKRSFSYDEAGKLIKQKFFDMVNPVNNGYQVFTYNDSGQIISFSTPQSGFRMEYFYSNGKFSECSLYDSLKTYLGKYVWTWLNDDLVKRDCYDKDGKVLTLTRSFEYDLSKENKLNELHPQFYLQDIQGYGQEIPFFFSKHLITASTDSYNGQPVNVENYTYTFNTHGFIHEIFETIRSDFAASIQYHCILQW